ncbi:MAG: alkaline phosphatase family protein [Rikenellaceae bacterium]|nr:alkaline phosphatase family protein [Rikenellaceae bacterium]
MGVFFRFIFAALLLAAPLAGRASSPRPRLVVNIVVGQMRYDYLLRFGHNMSDHGFRRFLNQGLVYTDARYNFMQTISPATLATLTTGADPSMHGVVSTRWIDYTLNNTVTLVDDNSVSGLDCDAGLGRYSPRQLTVPTLGDRLREQHPESKVITIAVSPVSAVILGGFASDTYWIDDSRGNWISSTYYMSQLPGWVERYNSLRISSQYLDYKWNLDKPRDRYVNSVFSEFDFGSDGRFKRIMSFNFLKRKDINRDYAAVFTTPAGNSLVTEFAKQAIIYEKLGKTDGRTDLINICYDSPRLAGEIYGGESMEVEDMFYRLDAEIADLVGFVHAQAGSDNVVIVLTSDHGASDSYDYSGTPRDRFNVSQFRVIVNGFMNTQYGPGDWVIQYYDRQLYLNRNLVYSKGLSLEEVQNRVAAFVLQFRGVSHVLTSTAMQSSFFSGSYAEKMQNSFYPRRSGDLTVNLMPGWIEEKEGHRTASGSMYEYDTHVPLMLLGPRFYGQRVPRTVNMRDVAPTLARIMGISRPIASEGEPLDEVARLYD